MVPFGMSFVGCLKYFYLRVMTKNRAIGSDYAVEIECFLCKSPDYLTSQMSLVSSNSAKVW